MNSSPWPAQPPPPGTQNTYGYHSESTLDARLYLTISANFFPDPAYHTVQVQQTFSAPPSLYIPMPQQQPQPPPVPAARKKIDWPQPVREYVQRAFDPSNFFEEIPRSEVEAKLKETITRATDSNALETIDWAKLPLPQQIIRNERANAAALAWQQQSVEAFSGNGTVLGKRNSPEQDSSSHPWRTTNNRTLGDRITDKRQQPFQQSYQITSDQGTSKFQEKREKRQKRFDGGYKAPYKAPTPEPSSGPVVGTCQTLEKHYFRLTSDADPTKVRPESVLKDTLEFLKKKWKKEGNYNYICDQFKSLRQDLTVQGIKNEFTVNVYEIHARIALEKGDLGEYNQCQTQLRVLYGQNLGGNPVEFKAYRILYFIHTSNRTALNDVLAELTTAEKEEKAIKHALNVRSALALGNYHRFFRLYLETPNMGAYLMDMFVLRQRLEAISNICKA